MRFALALLDYFPHGGMQRDALATAQACMVAGHEVVIFVSRWTGADPAGVEVRRLAGGGWSNHGRVRGFARVLADALARDRFDASLAFQCLPGVDAWFAADPCRAARDARRTAWLRALPRSRAYRALERALCASASATRILLVDPRQGALFKHYHGTQSERFVELPPGLAPDRRTAPPSADERRRLRAEVCAELGLEPTRPLMLSIGSDFRRKGVDRSMHALGSAAQLIAVGSHAGWRWAWQARSLGLTERVRLLQGRDDVPRLLAACDLLLHPAREENTGTVIVEALASGTPVVCSAACGYAGFVAASGAGAVVPEPFDPAAFEHAISQALAAPKGTLRHAACHWSEAQDFGALHRRIVEVLEAIGGERR